VVLPAADWANTSIASAELGAEIERLKLDGDGYIIADGGAGLFRSLIRLDLIDEYRVRLVPTWRARARGSSATYSSRPGSSSSRPPRPAAESPNSPSAGSFRLEVHLVAAPEPTAIRSRSKSF
jgi:hypothetical protein